jgi:hypothetical protein
VRVRAGRDRQAAGPLRSQLQWFGALGLARKPPRLEPSSTVTLAWVLQGSSPWAFPVEENRGSHARDPPPAFHRAMDDGA